MAHYRASESKREQFRRYLEKSGVLDTLTSIVGHTQPSDQDFGPPGLDLQQLIEVLVALYEEPDKPNNALDFIKLHLGAAGPDPADVEALRTEISELQQKCEALTEENNELKNKLMQCEPAPEEKPAE
ncbi:C-Myc-binding protein isoform X1 [Cynoglossus semilaevis]|uniref:MYC binding protein n=1 Tax=Cynoglossus semilaevis TaxID=244447 RepID=A0A3P8VE07_CYNSE|nr:c-Myc-binding protein-like isoform X1 [Cynoglossus semilaevis]